MNSTVKNILMIIGLLVVSSFVLKIVFKVLGVAMALAFKLSGVVVLAAVMYFGYHFVKTKLLDRR